MDLKLAYFSNILSNFVRPFTIFHSWMSCWYFHPLGTHSSILLFVKVIYHFPSVCLNVEIFLSVCLSKFLSLINKYHYLSEIPVKNIMVTISCIDKFAPLWFIHKIWYKFYVLYYFVMLLCTKFSFWYWAICFKNPFPCV